MGFGPNNKVGSHASEWDEGPLASIEEGSVLPIFFRGCSSSSRSGSPRSCTIGGGREDSCSVEGWIDTLDIGAFAIGFFNFFSAPEPLVLPLPLPFAFPKGLASVGLPISLNGLIGGAMAYTWPEGTRSG